MGRRRRPFCTAGRRRALYTRHRSAPRAVARGDVAQLEEHRVRIAGVRGSSPLISTTSVVERPSELSDSVGRVAGSFGRHGCVGRRRRRIGVQGRFDPATDSGPQSDPCSGRNTVGCWLRQRNATYGATGPLTLSNAGRLSPVAAHGARRRRPGGGRGPRSRELRPGAEKAGALLRVRPDRVNGLSPTSPTSRTGELTPGGALSVDRGRGRARYRLAMTRRSGSRH